VRVEQLVLHFTQALCLPFNTILGGTRIPPT